MMKRHFAAMMIPAVAIGLLVSGSSAQAAGNLVSNGTFTSTSGFTLSNSYSSNGEIYNPGFTSGGTVTGWSSAKYNFLFNAASPQNAYTQYGSNNHQFSLNGATLDPNAPGSNFVALDADNNYNGALTQIVTGPGLVAGQQYALTFDYGLATQSGFTGTIKGQLSASFGGDLLAKTTQITLDSSDDFSGWNQETIVFTATAAEVSNGTLSFFATSNSGAPPFMLLDNVYLQAVPEPSSIVLFGAGLCGLVAVQVRRRRQRAMVAVA